MKPGSIIASSIPPSRKFLAVLDTFEAILLEVIGHVHPTEGNSTPEKRMDIGIGRIRKRWDPETSARRAHLVLVDMDFKGTKKKKVNLRAKFDVIVFADENADIIKTGRRSPSSRYARYYSGSIPPEYEGGIGQEGVEALKSFVEQGGILVTLNSACGLAFNEFNVPAGNALERVDRSKFSCPGSILRVKVDNKS
ncbi:unnamed protein product, partial [marine sediment metagenome]